MHKRLPPLTPLLQLRPRRPRRLHNPRPPLRVIITPLPQFTLTIPAPSLKLPYACLSPLIRSLNQCRHSSHRGHIIPQPVLFPPRLILDITRVARARPVVRRRAAGQVAATEVGLEERPKGRGGGGGDADAGFDGGPYGDIRSSI